MGRSAVTLGPTGRALLGLLVAFFALLYPPHLAWGEGTDPLGKLYAEIVPSVGTETEYGIPLTMENAVQFASWYYEVRLSLEELEIVQQALAPLAAPCCDDNPLLRCCCERNGKICNLVRSARGLAAWLVQEKEFPPEKVRAAVLEWLRFAHGDYYVAKALADHDIPASQHGLTTYGACYRKLCEIPLSQGGCGGMGLEVLVSPPEEED